MKTERDLFEEWFKGKYKYSAEYFEISKFNDDKGFYSALDLYNPDSCHAAWVLRAAFDAWQTRVPEGCVVVPKEPSSEIIVAIESKIEDQLKASAIEADPFRLDGETIYEAMIEAVEK